jgi:protein involved in polysaccharide export with SLBB domain
MSRGSGAVEPSKAREERRGARWFAQRPVTLGLIAILHAAPVAAQAEYALGPEDRIRLKVFEWRASRDETFSWEALNDDYAVGSDGDLSLPLVGRINAAGATRDALAARISEQLAEQMGLGRRPSVAIEIIEYRPFYILGPVAAPGAYPFKPGLTILKAVSLAGGLATRADSGPRDAISGLGELEVLFLERDGALARIARLKAELADAEAAEAPPELAGRAGEAHIAQLILQEQAIFAARREAFQSKLAALRQLRADLQTEVPAQKAMLENVELQARSLREDLETITGVLTTMQARSMEREIAKLDGERLRGETSLLKAQQEVSRADLSIIELRTQRAQDLVAEIRATQAQIDQLGRRIETAEELVDDAESSGLNAVERGRRRLAPVYFVVREQDGRSVEMPAEETTAVEPGDAIKVEYRRTNALADGEI